MRIIIGAPGNGAALKDAVKSHLEADARVSEVTDISTPEITYPQVSFEAAQAIVEDRADRGILICGTGIGTPSPRARCAGCVRRRRMTW